MEPDDVTLDSARQEVEFCLRQIAEMESFARAIQNLKTRADATDDLIQKTFGLLETENWNNQLRDVLIKLLGAHVKYIKLLERRIGK